MMNLISDAWGAKYYIWVRENDMFEPETIEMQNVWMESGTGKWVMPGNITLTVEESIAYSGPMNDAQTFINEFVTAIIIGQKQLTDDTWNEYINGLKGIGIENCIKIQQDALNRYLNR